MKKNTLLIVVFLISSCLYAQDFHKNINGNIEFSEVIETTLKKNVLHSNAKEWVAKTFGDYKSVLQFEDNGKSSVRCPLKPKRFYPLKIFNNAPSKSLDRWGYYYFSLFPSVCRHLPDTFSV